MLRALWTAGSGMKGQQLNVDVIANNLANVNTTGYKKEKVEFKEALYETMSRAYMLDGEGKPSNLQVGFGSVVGATIKDFSAGNLEKTDSKLDFAIEGDGFFTVLGPTGDTIYTRDGGFKISITADGGRKLATSDGLSVLDDTGNEILLDMDPDDLNISTSGALSYTDSTGAEVDVGQKLGVVKFINRYGLESLGGNFYAANSATGEAILDSEQGTPSLVRQGFLEASNVQVVEEMVKMIVAQRAYEVSSKTIQSADEMLGMANNLRR